MSYKVKVHVARILLIDDDRTILELLEATLGGGPHEVAIASDAGEAVAAVGVARPDVILLDLDLPGSDGRQILEAIRGLGCQAPVIVLTGSGRARERELLSAGAHAYLTKPFSPLELIGRVEAMLSPTTKP